ncbi:hypothetical protein ACFQI7_20775 [Paenibacillus allorhizosphaerae]|uniref:DUF4367 domain-containing protein n=1 Tax=Paenibacillus allorhizosphaerae TaxID=2849866 RepID=A0ABM8VL14_9BACL|nr:hypothetical protein [Paenibacillus allorhizosphaerae]CAG7647924.1 hypothetical protein PAECIP111802_04098 [Paenibacillus allorhizosphaerae]
MNKTITTLNHRKLTKTALWFFVLIAAFSLTAGCGKPQAKPGENAGQGAANPPQQGGTAGQLPQTGTGQGQGQTGQPSKQPESAPKLTTIAYSDADKQILTATAKSSGVKTVYIPQQGATDDKLDVVRGTAKQMTLQYLKMVVVESAEQLVPVGKVTDQTEAKLKNGTAQWMSVNGQPTLYVKLGDTFISISSAKAVSKQELEAIADTLTPLK